MGGSGTVGMARGAESRVRWKDGRSHRLRPDAKGSQKEGSAGGGDDVGRKERMACRLTMLSRPLERPD